MVAKRVHLNVAPYKHGFSYGNGWTHVDGWSERIVDYIAAVGTEPVLNPIRNVDQFPGVAFC